MSQSTGVAKAPNPWWVGVVSGMASYIDSAAIVSNGIALVVYQQTIGLSDTQFGVLSGILTFGIALGAMTGGKLGDAFGRRRVFMATMAMIVVGTAFLIFGASFPTLLIGTILVGVGSGADLPVSLATIAENATDKNRGAILGLSNMLWSVGVLVTILLGGLVGDLGRLGGQIMYAHIGVVAFLLLVLRISLPETPSWLKACEERRRGVSTIRAEKVALGELVKGPYAKPFIALLLFYCLTNLAANTGGQFGTKIGVDIVGLSISQASLLGMLGFPVGIVGAIWFMRIVGTRYRMHYFVFGAALMIGSYFVPALFGFSLPMWILSGVLGGFGGAFAFEGIMKVWTQESFPTMLRSSAQGAIISFARIAAGVLALFTPNLLTDMGPRPLYATLGVIVAAGLGIAWWGFAGRQRNEFEAEERLETTHDLDTSSPHGSNTPEALR
ncbi:MFS transporter [Enemella evansiae]|uniref:MFS transporter n=1 Tax=Enemella evansiae TaxID=2016499 RepID=UPI001E3BFF3A|nr:MFS transporter [Enemella evansiae]